MALQSTGVYWIPLYDILENAACRYIWSTHPKNLPGRKSDVQESQWLLKLHTYGLLNQAPKPADVPTEVWINKPLNSNENTH